MPPTILTFGCRLNAAESAVMGARAGEAGLGDAVLVNTCAVTGEAVRQARQAIRKARREHPDKSIVVSGCAAQIDPKMFAAMPEVDLVLGNAEKLSAEAYRGLALPRLAGTASSSPHWGEGGCERSEQPGEGAGFEISPSPGRLRGRPLPQGERTEPCHVVAAVPSVDGDGVDCRVKPGNDDRREAPGANPLPQGGEDFGLAATEQKVRVSDIFAVKENAPHLLNGYLLPMDRAGEEAGKHVRSFVEVQNGCDHRCTFCIIPYGRGNSRSVPMGAVVEAVRGLVARGTREVALTGVDITSYGADLPGAPRLGRLVRAILRHVPELPRLRISSIDSVEADSDLLAAITEEERLMPHLHLSLQAGDDMILKRMKRRHSRADAIRFCDEVRRLRPDIVLGADLIAGFPTESDAMFEETLALVADCGLSLLHVFPFSAREGTPAARMPQVPRPIVQERAKVLREAGTRALRQRLAAEIGAIREVLVEKPGFGRSAHYLPVTLDLSGDQSAAGAIVSARIVGAGDDALVAEAIQEAA